MNNFDENTPAPWSDEALLRKARIERAAPHLLAALIELVKLEHDDNADLTPVYTSAKKAIAIATEPL